MYMKDFVDYVGETQALFLLPVISDCAFLFSGGTVRRLPQRASSGSLHNYSSRSGLSKRDERNASIFLSLSRRLCTLPHYGLWHLWLASSPDFLCSILQI